MDRNIRDLVMQHLLIDSSFFPTISISAFSVIIDLKKIFYNNDINIGSFHTWTYTDKA